MEVGRARGETAKDGSLEASDVLPFSGDQRTARIGRLDDLFGRFVAQSVKGHIRRAPRRVGHPDVERRGDRVVADVG